MYIYTYIYTTHIYVQICSYVCLSSLFLSSNNYSVTFEIIIYVCDSFTVTVWLLLVAIRLLTAD